MGGHHHHDHDHSHDHGSPDGVGRALKIAMIVTASFVGIEFVGGWISNSMALMTDATHMLTDSAALGISLLAFWLSKLPKSRAMSFGYQRAEILGALVNGLSIWFIAGIIIYESIQRFSDPPAVQGSLVIGIALIGLIVNIVTLKALHGHHEHSLNVKGAYLHVMGDLLGSIAAVASGVVIYYTGWMMIDPILSSLIAVLVLYSSWNLVRDSVSILMESTPEGVDAKQVRETLLSVSGVTALHDLHIWTVSNGLQALSVHLISEDANTTLGEAHRALDSQHGIHHTTIQIEHPNEFNCRHCFDCEPE